MAVRGGKRKCFAECLTVQVEGFAWWGRVVVRG
jgi:hypothetical protein